MWIPSVHLALRHLEWNRTLAFLHCFCLKTSKMLYFRDLSRQKCSFLQKEVNIWQTQTSNPLYNILTPNQKFFWSFSTSFPKNFNGFVQNAKKGAFLPFFWHFWGCFFKKNSISSYLRGQIKNCDLKPFELDPKELPKIFL